MQVTVERPQPCEAVMTVVVDDEQMEQARERAYREYAKYVNIPGFRPGKAPRPLVEQQIGREPVEKRARELVLGIAYKDALEQEEISAWDQGAVDEVEEDDEKPFSFKATVPLRPEVELGDYSQLTAKRANLPVTDESVQAEIDKVLASHARLEPGDDPANDADVVFADMDTTVGGEPIGATRPAHFTVGQNMPEIDAALRGAAAGDTRETDVEYPADFADPKLAGNTVHFTFRVNHVMARRVPELTEEWIKEHTGAQTEEELRSVVRQNLERGAAEAVEDDLRGQLINQIVDKSQVHFPTQLVDREVAQDLKRLSEDLEERGSNLERYAQALGQTLPQLQDQMAASASARIKRGLVMGKIAQVEGLTLTKDDVNAEIARIAQNSGMKFSEAKRRFKDEGALETLEERLLQERLFDYLKSRAEIEGEPATTESEA
ncbi:MAG TPA: trigger factor [Armatimonadota bacterium]|jgi:trigger factor